VGRSSSAAAAPPVVTVLAILLYLGGGLVVVNALVGSGGGGVSGLLPVWGGVLVGALYVGLARALQLGLRWAWRVGFVLCWVGLGLAAVYVLAIGLMAAVGQALWPAIYLVLLTRPATREWVASSKEEQG
jgi:hypothetical protein